jgi:hypothetical protein
MKIEIRHVFAAPIAVVLMAATTVAADDCCGILYPRRIVMLSYASPYACTEPAPPSRFPPVPIPNPFACDSPYCDPGYGGNPYAQGPLPLPPPPGGSYGTFPYGTNPYGVSPYGSNPYGISPSPFGSPPGTSPLTPGSGPDRRFGRDRPIFNESRTIAGVTKDVEAPQPLCKVSFWNQTGSELTLFVGDRTHRVQRDRAVVLALPREFSWKTDVLFDKREQVASDLNYFDVVIR